MYSKIIIIVHDFNWIIVKYPTISIFSSSIIQDNNVCLVDINRYIPLRAILKHIVQPVLEVESLETNVDARKLTVF